MTAKGYGRSTNDFRLSVSSDRGREDINGFVEWYASQPRSTIKVLSSSPRDVRVRATYTAHCEGNGTSDFRAALRKYWQGRGRQFSSEPLATMKTFERLPCPRHPYNDDYPMGHCHTREHRSSGGRCCTGGDR